MELRLLGHDVSLDEPPVHEEDDKPMEDWLEAEGILQEEMLERSLYDKALNSDLPKAIEQLDEEKQKKLFKLVGFMMRQLEKGATLDDMSKELGISKERVRQIEKKAFSKLKRNFKFRKKTMFNIVLVHPEIPPNTGNIIRLCSNTGCRFNSY